MINKPLKNEAVTLRMQGKSYSEVCKILGKNIPKSTLSYWFKDLVLSESADERIRNIILKNLALARSRSLQSSSLRRREYFDQIAVNNANLHQVFQNKEVSKIALAMLFLAEGSKRSKGVLVFCNSDPYVVSLFLHLLRVCYKLNEEKFRCTVQCRVDQDIHQLEKFWSNVCSIPLSKFSKAQIDKRSFGKPTTKVNYKGVCRIDYYSADVFHDLSSIPKIIYKGH